MPPIAASKEDVDRVEAKIDKVLLLLNGNGTPGLFTRLVLIEKWKEQREEEIEKEKEEQEAREQTTQNRVWEFAKPFIVNAINLTILIIAFLVVIHLPGVAALFGFELAK